MADFSAIRREGCLYVDKTRFVRELEDGRYAFLLRPRRLGKSCWVGVFDKDHNAAMAGMREWCDGYRFAGDAGDDVYSTEMVLNYLDHSITWPS